MLSNPGKLRSLSRERCDTGQRPKMPIGAADSLAEIVLRFPMYQRRALGKHTYIAEMHLGDGDVARRHRCVKKKQHPGQPPRRSPMPIFCNHSKQATCQIIVSIKSHLRNAHLVARWKVARGFPKTPPNQSTPPASGTHSMITTTAVSIITTPFGSTCFQIPRSSNQHTQVHDPNIDGASLHSCMLSHFSVSHRIVPQSDHPQRLARFQFS